tara:strand:+ start:191 stop:2740 length:2550 start_codon:yes stop_codon:yes gene_type:complete
MSLIKANGAGEVSTGFYSDVATQSALFASNHYMTETPSSAGNRKQFTFSWWMKKHFATGYSVLYSTAVSGSNNNTTLFHLYADNSNGRISAGGVDFAGYTVGYQRDTTNWYHCVVVVDTDQSSNDDRIKIYINGIKNSAMSGTCPQSNLAVNSTQTYHIGRRRINNDRYANLYLADFHLVDGTAISDTSRTNDSSGETEYVIDEFGEFNKGVWIPKAYSGSYGTNGFRLEFKGDGTATSSGTVSTPTNIGDDSSGNNHHHAVSSFVDNDSNIADSPENNFCTLNSLSAGDVNDMSKGNMQYADNRSAGTGQAKGTHLLESGKWYWEVHYDYDPGASNMIGIVAPETITSAHTAQDPNSGFGTYFAWDERGLYYQATDGSHSSTSGNTSYAAGDIISFALDIDAGKLFMRKNDGSFEDSGDPVNGTNPSFTFTAGLPMTPLVTNYRSSRHIFNFGQNPSFSDDASITTGTQTDSGGVGLFKYAPPTDYLAVCSKNFSDLTISPTSATQATDHFNTKLYTGNGGTLNVTGVGFKPDWVIIKGRDFVSNTRHSNSSSGEGKGLKMNDTTAESSSDTYYVTAFGVDGFSLNSGAGDVNQNTNTFVSHNWKANGGSLSTNDASSTGVGTIDSQIQANTTAGFSIVTWTGTDTAGTVAHGLGAKPDAIFVFNRDDISEKPSTFPNIIGATNYLYVHATNANAAYSGFFNDTNPTSTVFSVGTDNRTNGNGDNLLAFCFTNIEGYSRIGKYEMNYSSDGTFVYVGFRPAFLMTKPIDQAGSWSIYDSTRDPFNDSDANMIQWDGITAESGFAASAVDFTSGGFKLRQSSDGYSNIASNTAIFMAFAKHPFKFSNPG